jgi:hypothetical protein
LLNGLAEERQGFREIHLGKALRFSRGQSSEGIFAEIQVSKRELHAGSRGSDGGNDDKDVECHIFGIRPATTRHDKAPQGERGMLIPGKCPRMAVQWLEVLARGGVGRAKLGW